MTDIRILEKESSISWDTIHDILWTAHTENRKNGISMLFPSLPGDAIREKIENGHGKMFVALERDLPVGCGAYIIKDTHNWWCKKTPYMYLCFAGVLPTHNGKGIYRELYTARENACRENNIPIIIFDTHERNQHVMAINRKNGFIPIAYKHCRDHNNIVWAKWLNGCPYSLLYCKIRFALSYIKVKIKDK